MKFARKRPLIFSGVALALAGVVVGTFAVSQNSAVLNNVFEIADYETTFTEEFQAPSNWKTCDTVDKKIYVKNDTDVDIVARVKLDEEWTAANGMGLPLVSNGSGERMAIVNMTDNSGWTLDGTYYYSPTLAPGQTSTSVISGVTLNCDANLDEDYRYGNAQYKLSAKVETIQADRASTEWHKIAVLLPINEVERRLHAIAPINTQCTGIDRKFLQADSLTIETPDPSSNNVIGYPNFRGSNTFVYMWYDDVEDAVYWYSDADDVYLTYDHDSSQDSGDTISNYTAVSELFACYSDISGLYNINTSKATSLSGLFRYYRGATLHGVEKWDTSNVVSLYDFTWNSGSSDKYRLSDITAVSRWDVSNVGNMRYVFHNHSNIVDITALAGWNVRRATDFYSFLYYASVDESICEIADWPIRQNASGYNALYFVSKDTLVDAHCLDGWNIELDKSYSWFNSRANIFPSWAH